MYLKIYDFYYRAVSFNTFDNNTSDYNSFTWGITGTKLKIIWDTRGVYASCTQIRTKNRYPLTG